MIDWTRLTREMEHLLRLRTSPVAYKRLEKVEELEKIPGVQRLNHKASFCQAPALVRRVGMTIGMTKDDLGERCARICGLAATTEKEASWEATAFTNKEGNPSKADKFTYNCCTSTIY